MCERSIKVESVAGVSRGTLIYVRCDGNEYNMRVIDIDRDNCELYFGCDFVDGIRMPMEWGLAKDDVTVNEIFASVRGSAEDRSRVARYCIMDCALCNFLIMKMEIIANNVGMSNVCLVPLSYIFMRGQGIKIFSLVSKRCMEDGYMIPTLRSASEIPLDESSGGYEGAIVLTPSPGIYTQPIAVHDYGSLYPSSMISENISHDTIVLDERYDNIEGVEYVDVVYEVTEGEKKYEKRCRYAQNFQGVLPKILQGLLKKRKETRKKITYKRVVLSCGEVVSCKSVNKEERRIYDLVDNVRENVEIEDISDLYNDFEKAVLDGLQLAYKVTANSLYGQVGARTSQIYLKELAASTTATGRNLILKAKNYMESVFGGKVIYGDTDSIFSIYPMSMYSKEGLGKEEWIKETIDISIRFQEEFQGHLKYPHVLEYEKTGYPFIIFSKKRYVYNKYEFNPKKYTQSSMGIVLKRRDNANVVKKIYGGIIDNILMNGDIRQSSLDLKMMIYDFAKGEYEKEDLIVSKTLKATYKDPQRIAHKVLADRMFERDPGSAPAVNDRVQYIYIVNDKKGVLQGDRIESPEYIEEKGLKIDYLHYITNQIMKPCLQIFALPGVLEKIPGYRRPLVDWEVMYKRLLVEMKGDVVKASGKIGMMREEEAKKLIFEDTIVMLENNKKNQTMISKYFTN
jgi:DNA polymerase delta subunit 1